MFTEETLTKIKDKLLDILFEIGPDVLISIVVLVLGAIFIRLISRLLRKSFRKYNIEPSLATFIQSLVRFMLYAILIVSVGTTLGIKTSSFVAIIGAAGLAIGLALQGSLANFAGGVLILIFKPFKVDDLIFVNGIDGTVKEISIFTTKVKTFGNQIAIIPNGQLSNNNIINYNAEDTRRDKIDVGIGYSSNIKKAKDIMLSICAENDTILKDPKPEVYVGALADSSVNLTLRFWANNDAFWAAHFHVLEEIKHRFDAEGIEIPFPQRVIHQVK